MVSKFNSSSLNTFINKKYALFLLRVAPAVLLIVNHGFGKVMSIINGDFQFADPIGIGPELSFILAGFAEGIATLFVIAGYYTRLFAAILVVNFVVAYYAAGHELALLYLMFFFAIFLIGPGRISIDGQSRRRY